MKSGHSLDILIVNALVYDGSGGEPSRSSVGIKAGRIEFVGNGEPDARIRIDAEGNCLCPGFIDTHGHSEFNIIAAPCCESKILQGVTTEISGNCGLSAAPLLGEAGKRREDDFAEAGIRERWSSFDEYFCLLEKRRSAMNFVTLTGHGNIRGSVVGYEDRAASGEELNEMIRLLECSFKAGSFGFSTGLIYPPGVFTRTEELVSLLMPFKRRFQFIYATHMRSEGDRLIESVGEAIRIGRESGARIHLSHLKTAGKHNWHKIEKVFELIGAAEGEGLPITFDRYPYTASSTDLDTVLPSWVYEGGNEMEIRRLQDPQTRKMIVELLKSKHDDRSYYDSIMVSSVVSEKNKWTEGKTVLSIAEKIGARPEDALIDLLVQERLRVGAIFLSMSEENLRRFLSHPLCMVGSDSAVRNFTGITASGKPHPRAFGTFPRYLGRYVIREGLLPLSEGIRRITSFPAGVFGIRDRGLIRQGYKADLVIFDPNDLIDCATYNDPFRKPEGIRYVFVNGKAVVSQGAMVQDAGTGEILKQIYPV